MLREYGFSYPRRALRRGQVVIRVRNAGRLDHELVLIGLADDLPSVSEQLASPERRAVPTIAVVPARGPGRRGISAVDLQPGRYAFVCFVTDADGRNHLAKGMSSEFSIPPTEASTSSPLAPRRS